MRVYNLLFEDLYTFNLIVFRNNIILFYISLYISSDNSCVSFQENEVYLQFLQKANPSANSADIHIRYPISINLDSKPLIILGLLYVLKINLQGS